MEKHFFNSLQRDKPSNKFTSLGAKTSENLTENDKIDSQLNTASVLNRDELQKTVPPQRRIIFQPLKKIRSVNEIDNLTSIRMQTLEKRFGFSEDDENLQPLPSFSSFRRLQMKEKKPNTPLKVQTTAEITPTQSKKLSDVYDGKLITILMILSFLLGASYVIILILLSQKR